MDGFHQKEDLVAFLQVQFPDGIRGENRGNGAGFIAMQQIPTVSRMLKNPAKSMRMV